MAAGLDQLELPAELVGDGKRASVLDVTMAGEDLVLAGSCSDDRGVD